MSEGSFLSRWSRRKQAARQTTRPEPPGPEQPEPEQPGIADPHRAPAMPAEAEPGLSAEELARLPHPEDLTAQTDLTQFLRRGVPAALRKAALRKAWALDPAIRDYVGEARDYGYDWNIPGGVPGSGPLAQDDIGGLLRHVIGDGEAPPNPAPPRQPEPSVAQLEPGDAGATAPDSVAPRSTDAEAVPAGPRPQVDRPAEPAPVPRRHGGATPV